MVCVCPAVAAESVKVASIFGFTGVAVQANEASARGVRIGVKEINERGGVLGRRLELVEIDNRSTPIGSKVAADRAVKENVVAIVGPSWSSHSIAVAGVAQANKIPMISNFSTNEKVTRVGDYIFRVCFTDGFQGFVMAKFAREDLNARTAVLFVNLTSDYSMGLAKEFRKNYEALGGKVLLELHYKYKQEDFTDLILKAKKLNPDVLFIPGHDESGLIIKHAVNAGLNAIPIGGDGWAAESFYRKGAKRGYYSTHWSQEVLNESSQRFVQRYKDDKKLDSGEALGYDAVMLLADAINRAGSIEREKIRDALASTENFQGVTGSITFDSSGDPIKSAVIIMVQDGKPRFLKSILPGK